MCLLAAAEWEAVPAASTCTAKLGLLTLQQGRGCLVCSRAAQVPTCGTSHPQRCSRSWALRMRSRKEPSGVWWTFRLPGSRRRLAEEVTRLRTL